MGHAIAQAGVKKKYQVSFISGPVPVSYSQVEGAKNILVTSTRDMLDAVLGELESQCALVMAAAPADFRPKQSFDKKLKKKETKSISLVLNPDILEEVSCVLSERKIEPFFLIGFAAETHEVEDHALKKLKEKNLDIIFLNDLSQKNSGFGVSTNQLTVFRKDLVKSVWETDSKKNLGHKVIKEIENYSSTR